MKIGYIIASSEVMNENKPIAYLYREAPDNENDSGWRVFSGYESDEYANDASNFAMYNAETVIQLSPDIVNVIAEDFPVSFERDAQTLELVKIED